MMLPPRLIDGYQDFVETRLPLEIDRYQKLAEAGQRPEIMVICCCDSRVSPEVIFDAHPGELFVVRNIANLVPQHSAGCTHGISAALEFAVEILEVRYVIVMGHTHCGGIRAFVEHRNKPTPGDFIDNWMSLIAPAAEALGSPDKPTRADYLNRLERASIVTTLGNLLTFPAIRARVGQGKLQLIGAYFDVGNGALTVHDPVNGGFAPVANTAQIKKPAA